MSVFAITTFIALALPLIVLLVIGIRDFLKFNGTYPTGGQILGLVVMLLIWCIFLLGMWWSYQWYY